MSKARNYCFTLNNYTDEEIAVIQATAASDCVYMVYGHEVGESGTPHLQGYCKFKSPRSFSGAKKKLVSRAHLEVCKGSPDQNFNYCVKEGRTIWEHGDRPQQGQRNDLKSCMESIRSRKRMRDVWEEHPTTMMKYHKGMEKYRQEVLKDECSGFKEDFEVLVYWGESGTGKTRKAYADHPGLYSVDLITSSGVWWDGYDGEDTILFDDFYGGVPYGMMLKLLHGHPSKLNSKGTHKYKNWKRVIITSNKPPEQWYKMGLTPALKRRLTKVVHFGEHVFNPTRISADAEV